MKFWQKIFIYSLLLFLISLNFGSIFLIENSHNLNLKREIDRSISEQSNILSGISYYNMISNYYLNTDSKEDSKSNYKEIIKNYLKKINSEDIYLEVLDKNNDVVFSNLKFKVLGEREELKNVSSDERKYIIRDVGNRTLLFITGLVHIQEEDLKLSYIHDVTYIYEDRKQQYNFFIELSIIVTIILAIGMYILSKYITSPIDNLINTTRIVSKGNYSERVAINSKDEIGILAENFNKMADAVEGKINELELKAEEKQRFIDNFTHELKTPLTAIIGYADFLRSTSYNEEIFIEGLNHIFKEGKRLEELSWKMMDLILLKRENFKMKKENIKNILEELKDILKPKLQNKNIDLIICGEEHEIVVEKDLISNLISNLIDNSIKASKEDSNIYLNVYKNKESKVVLQIKDEGIGISKEDIPKVFEAFYMVDKSRTRANNGAGLGLAICAEIAKIHQAELEIESELKKGTTIKIIFN
ncbi:signal transduction histidine kinase [Clostridium tetanomorphum]|uniref:histidine kinase n=1 Tax=Clostridium tetanomorphum TaxID=1553 RepID=A0A923EAZ7_CLOTT|nr:HAMP domain-containing sensor histidine kinase [Clostridium tetanomorphum]MBC2399748.1 HAMP domain-containing histidine kinase [Clostridium tetanomorphum]MBP1864272.1 signal transduction histidine kinase [Clostridium tetanomorphum]NRS83719.1 signal transduction histidine kinase [Clostridium tetanomorphum]NRZ96910.1 signal transduction histidine kinase [Clostridium tetanomorphum]SQC02127.1 signal transduction histidine kinase [Clostridium tetanomorphum]